MIFYRGFLNLLTDGRTDEQADMSETIILMISRLPAGFFFFFFCQDQIKSTVYNSYKTLKYTFCLLFYFIRTTAKLPYTHDENMKHISIIFQMLLCYIYSNIIFIPIMIKAKATLYSQGARHRQRL